MEQLMRQIINDVFYDLEEVCRESGDTLDAEILADVLGDRMYDMSEEYRTTPWEKRRAMTLQIAQQYV